MMYDNLKAEFELILKKYNNLIYTCCLSFCSGNKDDAEDIFQQVASNLWKDFCNRNGEVKVSKNWIYKITINTSINYRKAYMLRSKIFTSLQQEDIAQEQDYDTEKINILYELINMLNNIDKTIIQLYLDGNSYQNIAQVLNITESNVSTRIQRIKKKLKALKESKYGREDL